MLPSILSLIYRPLAIKIRELVIGHKYTLFYYCIYILTVLYSFQEDLMIFLN